ncbi:MAG: prephenate/arogenate dehydrogenase family protein [Alphaproteobacteria bacterium]|nr:prephenate/arogenate dehydrogenase family protein [Alphaproteobacteria bacterium]
MSSSNSLFDRVAIIGIGLIGSSLALAMRQKGLARTVVCGDANPLHVKMALELELVDEALEDNIAAVKGADLVILALPVGAMGAVMAEIAPHLAKGCIVTDVGSVKRAVMQAVLPHLPAAAHFVPGHPIAGTENSGPEAGFAELFQDRWVILTPLPETGEAALNKIAALWKGCGAKVEIMEPAHHDRVLAMTSHLPHLAAFTAVRTADDLAQDLDQDVIRFAGSSFRDFTRVAASDPVMWRDIFLNNRDAVLEILQRFKKDLAALEVEVAKSDGAALEERFAKSRAIRRNVGGGRFGE